MRRSLRDHLPDDAESRTIGVGLSPMETYRDWEEIVAALERRGYNSAERRMLCGGSFAEYFDRVV
jgi:microsomal dipeptidase-like Zn-dependent dipeptidase